MSEADDFQTNADTFDPETVPLDERPGHEQINSDNVVTSRWQTDTNGHEWFVVGDTTGLIRIREPVDVEP